MTPPIKDFRVQVKLSNNQLKARREALRLSAPEFAVAVGISYSLYIELEGLRKSPMLKNGQWRPDVLTLAQFHKCEPDDLFTDAHLAVKKRIAEIEVSAADIAAIMPGHLVAELPGPVQSLEKREIQSAVEHALAKLTQREEQVIRLRYGFDGGEGLTLEETSTVVGLAGRERVRQIEAKALRKLRHPWRSTPIRHAAYGPRGDN
jgi:hypothetical protein